jgi:hypothetical protein
MQKRYRKRIPWGIGALAIAVAGLAPASASADIIVFSAQLSAADEVPALGVRDPSGEQNTLVFTLFTPSGGSQDIVLADTTAGIGSFPADCFRIDISTIRCPATAYAGLIGDLGGGDDRFIFNYPSSEANGPYETNIIDLIFGAGNDQVSLEAAFLKIASEVKYALGPGNDAGAIRGQIIFGAPRKAKAGQSSVKRAVEVLGGSGRDLISGGKGAEVLKGGDGGQLLNGGPGADTMKGGNGSDKMNGGGGSDLMFGGPGIDFMYGNGGRDFIRGGGANDHGNGGAGDDNVKD